MRQKPGDWLEERTHARLALEHMKGKEVPQHRHAFWYVFGGFALFLLGLQFVTGALMLMRYVPSAAPAAAPVSGRLLCIVRAADSIVDVEVTDTTLADHYRGERIVYRWTGSPQSAVPQELQGKSKIVATIPKDSIWLVTYTEHPEVPDDTSDDAMAPPAPIIEEQADVPRELRAHLPIVRDSTTKAIVHPSAAYASIERITRDVPYGGFIRGMHAYGANLLVACIFLHMFSTFFFKGYRRPRELMWLSGVVLLAIMLGFGFTGYLLPWNVLSYYATRVGVGYPESFIPGIGPWIADLMRGGGEVTGETLTRMYALHVVALPLSVVLFAGVHLTVLQVHGVSTPVGVQQRGMNLMAAIAGAIAIAVLALYRFTAATFEVTSPWVILPLTVLPMVAAFVLGQVVLGAQKNALGERGPIRFYWNFAMRDYIGWLLGLAVLVALAIAAPWNIGGAAGAPIDIAQPLQTPVGIHPEWYFMFMFQFLRIMPGEIAMMVIGAAGAAWCIIPFLDKQSQRGLRSPKFTRVGIVIVAVLLALTWYGYQAVGEEVRESAHAQQTK